MKVVRFIKEAMLSLLLLHQRIYEIKYIVLGHYTSGSLLITTRIKGKERARNKALKKLGKLYHRDYLKVEQAELVKEIYLKAWDTF